AKRIEARRPVASLGKDGWKPDNLRPSGFCVPLSTPPNVVAARLVVFLQVDSLSLRQLLLPTWSLREFDAGRDGGNRRAGLLLSLALHQKKQRAPLKAGRFFVLTRASSIA
ncbi:unnamed protein product, partial [Amoebophrya sp. A120]